MFRKCCWARAVPMAPVETPMIPAGFPAHTPWPGGREPWSRAFLTRPGIERLYSGETKRRPDAALISFFIRTTSGAGCSSSSWLYSGRSPIRTWRKENSGGASFTMASASFRLNESFRRLPTITAIWYWFMHHTFVGVQYLYFPALSKRHVPFKHPRAFERNFPPRCYHPPLVFFSSDLYRYRV